MGLLSEDEIDGPGHRDLYTLSGGNAGRFCSNAGVLSLGTIDTWDSGLDNFLLRVMGGVVSHLAVYVTASVAFAHSMPAYARHFRAPSVWHIAWYTVGAQ